MPCRPHRHRHGCVARIKRNPVLHLAMVHKIQTGVQTGAGWAARHGCGDMVFEGNPLRAKPIKIGGMQIRGPKMGHAIRAPLIHHD